MNKNQKEIIVIDDEKPATNSKSLSNLFGLIRPQQQKEVSVETELSKLTRTIFVGGQKCRVNPVEVIRQIKMLTQQIGQYKSDDNPMSLIIVRGLRSSRAEFVQILEQEFKIFWKISLTGDSIFFR